MNNFEKRTNKKKHAIIVSALDLFKANGIENTNMELIAKTANVSKVSIYNYFTNKNNLVKACIHFVTAAQMEQAEKILDEKLSFEKKLDKVLQNCVEHMDDEINYYFTSEVSEANNKYLDIIVDELNKQKNEIYFKYIEQGKKEYYFTSAISTDSIILLMEGINIAYAKQPSSGGKMSELHYILFNGILNKIGGGN